MVAANHAARIVGLKLKPVISTPQLLAEVLVRAWRDYRYDLMMIFTDTMVEAEALGCRVALPDDDDPYLVGAAAHPTAPRDETRAAVDPAESADQAASRIPVVLEALKLIVAATHGNIPVLTSLKGPFTLACFLTGVERFLTNMRTDPASCHAVLARALAHQQRYLAAIQAANGVPFIGDPLTSGDIISRRDFQNFALPYLQQLVQAALPARKGLHICGDTSDRLDLMRDTGAAFLSVDAVDLRSARAALGPDAVLMGNVATTLLAQGTAADIRNAARRCLADAGPRLILSSACDVPRDTPPDNIRALVHAIRDNPD
jgi:uroporphyrinogen decarboxylase